MSLLKLVSACVMATVGAFSWPVEPSHGGAVLHVVPVGDHRGKKLTFSATGRPVRDLYPGSGKDMEIVLANPNGYAIHVTDLWIALTASSTRRCPATSANLRLGERRGPALPARISARGEFSAGSVHLSMPASVGDGCAGATFTIRFSGTAKKVNR